MILRAALAAGVARLNAAGIDGAARDARALLAEATGLAPARISLEPDFALSEAMQSTFDAFLRRRAAGEPVSKILGRREFWGRVFRITPDVLDPRPETETLVAAALEGGPTQAFADLGTGSGILAITLLCEWPGATATATDISAAALRVVRDNAEAHGVADRLTLHHAPAPEHWFDGVPRGLDLIVANPPYIGAAEMAGLSREVLNFDPQIALTPGGDGLAPYRAIAREAARHLLPRGRLLVEIGHQQGRAVSEILTGAGLRDVALHRDMDGRDRVVSANAP